MSEIEPLDVGPAVGGDLQVTAADRDHVVSLLNAAFAEGHLGVAERDRRIGIARQAEVFDDLIPLTRDLLNTVPSYQPPIAPVPATGFTPLPETKQSKYQIKAQAKQEKAAAKRSDSLTALLGSASRKGVWQAPERIRATAFMGGVDLDFRQAVLTSNQIEVDVAAFMGGVDIIVPPGYNVDVQVTPIMGSADQRGGIFDPSMPTITVHGWVIMGSVDLKVKDPK
ncbi:MAG: DUF1707 domain-containing protein [Propionibacteriaceae bacterium]|jgi:hypothetical protein|nr:DUF1707 domain-containing protein [Propionibacteriaceae bacterium]